MNRRHFIGIGSGCLAAGSAAGQQSARPNLLLIMTDQQSHTAWSGARNPALSTPAIDSLAASGTVFEEAYCAYPVCSPSRGSIFSSRLPHETGVMENGRGIAAGIPTLGEIIRAAGYRTAYAGKWHLPKPFDGMTGFEKIAGGDNLGAVMDAPAADACIHFLDQASARPEPYFLVASFMNPHDICDWIRQHTGTRQHPQHYRFPQAPGNMAAEPDEPAAIQYHRTAKYDLMSQAVDIASSWRRDDFRQYLDGYYRLVENVDLQIGRVLAALQRNRLDTNTIVLFVSDHGEGMGGHRWVQKASFYEESVHVPLIVSGPGVPRGRRVTELGSLLDILPTFCDYAGVPVPAGTRGISLRPAIDGKPLEREFVTSHLRYGTKEREGRMLRTARYKYIAFNCGPRAEQLFDLWVDPGECRDLTADSASAEALREHRSMLRQQLLRTNDDFAPAI